MTRKSILSPFKKIRFKASLFVLFLLVLTTAALSIISLRIMNRHILGEVIKRAETLCQSTASTAGYNLISQDLLGLDNMVYKVKSSNPDVEYMAVLNLERKFLVHSNIKRTGETFLPTAGKTVKKSGDGTTITESGNAQAGLFEVTSPVVFMDKPLGSVVLGINKSVLLQAQRAVRRDLTGIFVLLLFGGVGGSLLLSSFLTKPIQQLSVGVAELKEGKRRRPLRVYSRDELGRLTESFNEMTALITSQRHSLSQYAQELEDAYIATVRVLAAAIDARDTYTLGHSTRVARLSVELGRDLGLGPQELEEIEIACLFHDVGTI
ncbi:MAG: HAMP domain-containing protein, partial [Acidobacteriota bacterium]